MRFKSQEKQHLIEALADELGSVVLYRRLDPKRRLADLRERVANLSGKADALEDELPELREERDEAKRYFDQARAGRIPELLDNRGQLPTATLQDARGDWQAAEARLRTVSNTVSSLRQQAIPLRAEIEELEGVKRPETPLLAELLDVLRA